MAVPFEVYNYYDFNLKYSKLKSIDGRLSDIITLPNGGNLVIPSFFGSRMLKNVSGIKQYQVQKTKDKIIVNLIVDNDFKDDSKKIIFGTLDEYIPREIGDEVVFNQNYLL